MVDRVKAITGRIDLVHANDSRDAFDSGADRHANLTDGHIDPDAVVAVVRRRRRAGRWSRRPGWPRVRAPTSPCCGPRCRPDGSSG